MTALAPVTRPGADARPDAPIPVFLPGHPFSRAELHALAADGVLRRELLEAHVHAWQPPSDALRIAVLSRVVPGNLQRRGVLGRLGAAWFHRCAPEPSPLPVLVDKGARTTTSVPAGIVLHQTSFGPQDLVTHRGITLTSPHRTAVDLALHVPGPAGDAALLAMLGSEQLSCTPAGLVRELETMPKTPGRRAALARARKLARALEG
ncbi:type IV toxin-antitoxin system AbiEi family antitoxin [Kocuria sp.]|uniref:type IV toxin-antitoxin system AbiEi family antitoxin n=1 Tax=Kocuria sp. TaxID=1871328 RepID=UPI0026DD7949|nr:type IV toxin-antitoxin system AbiEi family antitoxin [Kocuria sp.]MDO4919469.1 type IV toxin-antitoxin system AbiEi family antitoxin [Kocuria sp.]